MNLDILIAFLGGIGLFVAPVVCLRSIIDSAASRTTAITYAVVAAIGLCLCLYLALSAWFAALLGFVAAAAGRHVTARAPEADIVVTGESALLADSMSPQLAAGLAELEVQAKEGSLRDTPEAPHRAPQEAPVFWPESRPPQL